MKERLGPLALTVVLGIAVSFALPISPVFAAPQGCAPPAASAPAAHAPQADEGPEETGETDAAEAAESADDAELPTLGIQDEMVVSATRVELPRASVGSTVTVISREEIEARHAVSALDLLDRVPGIETGVTGGPGGNSSIFLRGGNANHTLVLVDGVRMNENTTGAFNLADLSADAIERIEVLRGPQSTLYGSEAMGGVVSIFTRRGEGGFQGGLSAEAGSSAHRRLQLDLSGRRVLDPGRGDSAAFDYAVTASGLETDGVSAASEERGNTETDPYENRSLTARLGWEPGGGLLGEESRLDLTVREGRARASLDGFAFGIGPVDDLDFTQDRDIRQAALTYRARLAPRWRQSASLQLAEDDLRGDDPTDPFSNYAIDSRTTTLTTQGDVDLTPGQALTLGGSFERREADNAGSFSEEADIEALFLEHRWAPVESLTLTSGARHDRHSRFGSETTYRLAASWVPGASSRPEAGGRLHASYGTGFKAPTFNELFFPGAGNPDLDAETSAGFDVGWEQSWGEGASSFEVVYFETRYENLIDFDLSTFTFANLLDARTSGVEASLRLRPADFLELTAGYTYTDSENRATGSPLPRRPRHRGSLQAGFDPGGRWSALALLALNRDRVDSDGLPMDDYERLDLTVDYEALRFLDLYLRAENLLDAEYEVINGYTTPGRVAVLGARLGF